MAKKSPFFGKFLKNGGQGGRKLLERSFLPPHYTLTNSTAAAEEYDNYSNYDPPNVVITEEIAQAVIHKDILRNSYDV